MAKTKRPLLSLAAQGTIADTLTYQRHPTGTISRAKPILPYFLTLPSRYQRWLYQDYAYLWRQQSAATKATYRATGSRHHLTGFQYWMSYNLTHLPDITALYHLDVNNQPTTPDSSRNESTATIIGAQPATGPIAGALHFDGINDQLTTPDLGLSADATIELFVYATTLGATTNRMYSRDDATHDDYTELIQFRVDDILEWRMFFTGGVIWVRSALPYSPLTLYHIACVRTGNVMDLYTNHTLIGTATGVGTIVTPTWMRLGAIRSGGGTLYGYHGTVDHAVIYNRALDLTEITRHSLRRWPQQ